VDKLNVPDDRVKYGGRKMTPNHHPSSPIDLYDVGIIGGGPGGLSAAIYAARAGLSTLVLDKNPTAGALGITDKIRPVRKFVGLSQTGLAGYFS
jgi:thioredoxin reductase (NADPH)